MIIAPQSFFTKKPLLDTMDMISSERGTKVYDPNGEKPHYNAYPYNIFAFNLPKHVEVPLHEIVPIERAIEFMQFERISRTDSLQKILSSDPPVVWLGARDGQIIKIYRPSETTLETIVYRRVFSIARSMPIST
jgi:DNA-directed RNA polymerase subunit H (RpoH/RPB5)